MGLTSRAVGENKSQKVTRGSHRNDVSPLTQGLRYHAACDEVKLYLLQQLLVASQTGNAIGFRQLLFATSFDTVEPEIAINYSVYSQSVNGSFT